MDGNFHCERMKSKRPENDVALRNGEGFAVETQRYAEHITLRNGDTQEVHSTVPSVLLHSNSSIQKSSCSNHKAINQATAERKAKLDVSGVGACACARHGLILRNSLVDIQKGER